MASPTKSSKKKMVNLYSTLISEQSVFKNRSRSHLRHNPYGAAATPLPYSRGRGRPRSSLWPPAQMSSAKI
jgi:hypothetical protein